MHKTMGIFVCSVRVYTNTLWSTHIWRQDYTTVSVQKYIITNKNNLKTVMTNGELKLQTSTIK